MQHATVYLNDLAFQYYQADHIMSVYKQIDTDQRRISIHCVNEYDEAESHIFEIDECDDLQEACDNIVNLLKSQIMSVSTLVSAH
jgi:S-adenosylmethionine/arginine decarboxylase-like enzyme